MVLNFLRRSFSGDGNSSVHYPLIVITFCSIVAKSAGPFEEVYRCESKVELIRLTLLRGDYAVDFELLAEATGNAEGTILLISVRIRPCFAGSGASSFFAGATNWFTSPASRMPGVMNCQACPLAPVTVTSVEFNSDCHAARDCDR